MFQKLYPKLLKFFFSFFGRVLSILFSKFFDSYPNKVAVLIDIRETFFNMF